MIFSPPPQYISKCSKAYKNACVQDTEQLNCHYILRYCRSVDSSVYRTCLSERTKQECNEHLGHLQKEWRNKLVDDNECFNKRQYWCSNMAKTKADKHSELENFYEAFALAQPGQNIKAEVAGLSSSSSSQSPESTEDL